jgi:hypothetical protein
MSIYTVNYIGHEVLHDDELRRALKTDPQHALADLELNDQERAALLAGDVATLYQLGAHEYLLYNLARMELFGLDAKRFSDRIRGVTRPVSG